MRNQYDYIKEKYTRSVDRIVRRMLDQAFLRQVGNVQGKTILDLGCGQGNITRKLKLLGASYVVGVDISGEMLKLARHNNELEYIQGDVRCLGKIDEFDIVTGAFILHYASTKEELYRMAQSAYDNLRLGGRFIVMCNNPQLSFESYSKEYKKYEGYPVVMSNSLDDGSIIKWVVDLQMDEGFEFNTYYFSVDTYNLALESVGFKAINWIIPTVTKEFLEERSRQYWQYLIDNPFIIIVECRK